MAQSQAEILGERITWDFMVSHNLFTSRYGSYRDQKWKQFLPGGNLLPGLHPPRKIPSHQYDMARKRAIPE